MVFRTLIKFSAQKRIPMIKFRKGGNVISSGSQPQSVSAPAANKSKPKTASASAAAPAGKISTAVEYWELHPRFQRRPIDEAECEYINRGGPDKL